MGRNSPVIDISSDEEGDFEGGNYSGGGGYYNREDREWLYETLGRIDDDDDDDDDDDSDDDVVVVSEVDPKPMRYIVNNADEDDDCYDDVVFPNPRSSQRDNLNNAEEEEDGYADDDGHGEEDVDEDDGSAEYIGEVFPKPMRSERYIVSNADEDGYDEDDGYGDNPDDGDCVILDSEPCGSEMVENSGANDDDDDDDDMDDVQIVAEKGEVACRDFPHARHHCAKFPFDSTPHQVHCHQCHCYVCDSIAPCRYWGTGQSDFDHCNANEKLERWVNARKNKSVENQDTVSPIDTPQRIVFFNRSHSSSQQSTGPVTADGATNSAYSSEETAASKHLPYEASRLDSSLGLENVVPPQPDIVFEPNRLLPSLTPYSQPSVFSSSFGNQTPPQFPVDYQLNVGLENGVPPQPHTLLHPNRALPSQRHHLQPLDTFDHVGNHSLSKYPLASQPNWGVGVESRVLPPQPSTYDLPNTPLPSPSPYPQPSYFFNDSNNQTFFQSPATSQPNFGVDLANRSPLPHPNAVPNFGVPPPQPDQFLQPNRALPFQNPCYQPAHVYNNQTLRQPNTSSSYQNNGDIFESRFPIHQEYRIPAPASSSYVNASSANPENPQISTGFSQTPDLEPEDYSQYQTVTKENEQSNAPKLEIHLKSVARRDNSSALDAAKSHFKGSSNPDPSDSQFDNCTFNFDEE